MQIMYDMKKHPALSMCSYLHAALIMHCATCDLSQERTKESYKTGTIAKKKTLTG
jgi:hypothetical protein